MLEGVIEKLLGIKEALGNKISSLLTFLPEGKRSVYALIVLILMIITIPVAAYLVQTTQVFKPKATGEPIKLFFGRGWNTWASTYNLGNQNLNTNMPVDIFIIAGNRNIVGVDAEILYDGNLSTTGEFTINGGNFDTVLIPSNRKSSVIDRGKSRFTAYKKGTDNVKSGTFLLGTINLRITSDRPATQSISFGRVQIIESGGSATYGNGNGETIIELGQAVYNIPVPTATPGPTSTPTATPPPGVPGTPSVSWRIGSCLSGSSSHPNEIFDVSWTNVADRANRVEISTSADFFDDAGNDFFHRKSFGSGIINGTSGPKGFTVGFGEAAGSNLTINPGTTYYVRVHNTGGNSSVASFSKPACPTPTHTITPTPTGTPVPTPTTVGRMSGDANDDRCITPADYTIWKDEARRTRTTHCANWAGTSDVDIEDYNVWYQAWIIPANRENCIIPAPNTCLNRQ